MARRVPRDGSLITEQSLFDYGRQLSKNGDARGLDRAMNDYEGTERQEVLDGWFEGALELAVEAYTKALRLVPYGHRNDVIIAVSKLTNQYAK